MQPFEGLGTFYLGQAYALERGQRTGELVLYDSRDLVTHAVIVGMTGSGKTGLGTVLVEEAALDGIPAIVIDPKGDLANLLLSFPALRADVFRPWVSEQDAARAGKSQDEFAAAEAERWKAGLAQWGQDEERIARLRAAAEFRVFTPGSSAGAPLSVLKSFGAPDAATRADAELLQERVSATATGLLTLLDLEADPVKSREHVLLSQLFQRAWSEGRDLDLGALIREVQSPPLTQVGVLDLESFFPAKERAALALQLNQLLASPGFASWMQGEPLDIGALLFSPQGQPRVSVLSIAHLSDAERMFFLSLFFSETVAWMRRQSGTGSLRALVYMDEVAVYLPPVAVPATKPPLLVLLKQARAFGLGLVLATQNPADLDYKALSNAGTWFIGRLTTERDKLRLLDGLEGAAAGALDRATLERTLSSLSKRVFLLNNVHEDAPQVFETRWAMSYLRGPLTRIELKQLASTAPSSGPSSTAAPSTSAAAPAQTAAAPPASVAPSARAGPAAPHAASGGPPVLPAEIVQVFLRSPRAASAETQAPSPLLPHLFARASLYFDDSRRGIRAEREVAVLVQCPGDAASIDWRTSALVGDLLEERAPPDGAAFAGLPAACSRARSYEGWRRELADHLARTHTLELWQSPTTELLSGPGETERDFRARLALALREARDAETEKLRKKYAPKLAALEDRVRRAQQKIEVQAEQAQGAKVSGWLSVGTALLGAFTGRKLRSVGNASRAASAARGFGRASKEASDVERAKADLAEARAKLAELESEFQAVAQATASRIDAASERLETIQLAPKKKDVVVRSLALAWAPQGFGS